MGASSTHRPAGIPSQTWCEDNLCGDLWDMVAFAAVGKVYYFVADSTSTGERVLFVVQTWRAPRSHFNFTYKAVSEDCGPNESTCPDRLLDLMGTPPNDYAAKFRDRCRAYNARPKVVKGSRVRFAHPISFQNGAVIANFVYEGRNTFAEADGYGRYSISGWKERAYEVLAS